MAEKACKKCKIITDKETCPLCGSKELVSNWAGYVIVLEPQNSEIAKRLGAKVKGRYTVRVRK